MLDRQLDVLRAEGVGPVILIGGFKAEALAPYGLTVRVNPRYADTNMVWSLFCAEDQLSGDVLVAYGDIVYSRDILQAVMSSDAEIAVAVDTDWRSYWTARSDDPLADAESLRLSSSGQILELGQRPGSLDEIQGQYMGIMKFSPAGIEALRRVFAAGRQEGSIRGKPVEKAYMTDLLQAMIDRGERLQAVQVSGGWVEVDTVEDLVSAVTRDRLSGIERQL